MESNLQDINGHQIFINSWPINNPKAAILIVHGFAEHSSRYQHVADFFNTYEVAVMSYDLIGHGQSEGIRAYVNSFDEYETELEIMTSIFKDLYKGIPLFVLGHSMGGLIVSQNAINKKLNGINNIILSNPAFDIVSNQPKILVGIVRLLARIAPKMHTVKLDSQYISRDPEVRKSYDNDPLNYRKGSRPGMVDQFDKAGQAAIRNASSFDQNLFLNYSASDTTIAPQGSVDFFSNVSSKDKKIQNYQGLFHELLNEPEKDEIMQNMLTWINERLAKSQTAD